MTRPMPSIRESLRRCLRALKARRDAGLKVEDGVNRGSERHVARIQGRIIGWTCRESGLLCQLELWVRKNEVVRHDGDVTW
jgi:hypothetical protein